MNEKFKKCILFVIIFFLGTIIGGGTFFYLGYKISDSASQQRVNELCDNFRKQQQDYDRIAGELDKRIIEGTKYSNELATDIQKYQRIIGGLKDASNANGELFQESKKRIRIIINEAKKL